MNYGFLKEKMDKFFEGTTPQELMAKFEDLGYVFIDNRLHYKETPHYEHLNVHDYCYQSKLPFNLVIKNKIENLDKFEVFLCNLALW